MKVISVKAAMKSTSGSAAKTKAKSVSSKKALVSPKKGSAVSKPQKSTNVERSRKPEMEIVAKVFKLSLSQQDWRVLENFFLKKGLRTATGIKMILRDFIERSSF